MTQLGELMVEFPLHPGLTRAVLKAASLGCQDLLLPVAAMLSVENIFIRPGQEVCFKVGQKAQLQTMREKKNPQSLQKQMKR